MQCLYALWRRVGSRGCKKKEAICLFGALQRRRERREGPQDHVPLTVASQDEWQNAGMMPGLHVQYDDGATVTVTQFNVIQSNRYKRYLSELCSREEEDQSDDDDSASCLLFLPSFFHSFPPLSFLPSFRSFGAVSMSFTKDKSRTQIYLRKDSSLARGPEHLSLRGLVSFEPSLPSSEKVRRPFASYVLWSGLHTSSKQCFQTLLPVRYAWGNNIKWGCNVVGYSSLDHV